MNTKYTSGNFLKMALLFSLMMSFHSINATEYFLRAVTTGTRNWNDTATWSTVSSSNATNTGTYPQAGDTVVYQGSSTTAITLKINSNAVCDAFTNQATNTSTVTITIASGMTLTVNGNFQITGIANINKICTLSGAGGTLVVTGDINIGTAGIATTTNGKYTRMNFAGPNINLDGNINMYNIVNGSSNQGAFVNHSAGKLTLLGTDTKGYINSYQPGTGLSSNNKYTTAAGSATIEFHHVTDCPIYTQQGITNAPVFNANGSLITYTGSGAASVIYGTFYNRLNLNNPSGYTINGNVTITNQMDMVDGNLNIGVAGLNFSMNANTKLNISSGDGITGESNRFRYNGSVDITYSGSVTKAGIELRTGIDFTDSFLNSLTITGTSNFNLGTSVGKNSLDDTSTSLYVLNNIIINDSNFTCNMPVIHCPNITVEGGVCRFNETLGSLAFLTLTGNTTIINNTNITNTIYAGANITNSGVVTTKNLSITANTTLNNNTTGKLLVTDVLSVSSGAVLQTGGELILYSDASKTARVDVVSSGAITGEVTVQRYLINAGRKWRLLTSPLKGSSANTIYVNWQNNGIEDGLTGTDVWGPVSSYTPTGNGMNYLPVSTHNFRKYNSGVWSNITDTKTEPLFGASRNNAFLTFIIYPYGEGVTGDEVSGYGGVGNSSNTKLIAKGSLITGDQTYTVTDGIFQLIGNPYASPIDMESLILNGGVNGNVVDEKIWIIDPNIGDYGGYVTWDPVNKYSAGGAENALQNNHLIQSGQAFFVKAKTSPSSTTFSINETFKRAGANSIVFGRVANTSVERIRVSLEKNENNVITYKDGCVAAFYAGGSNAFNEKDAEKFTNPNETLAFMNGTTSISSEHRAPIANNDELFIRVTRAVVSSYKLKIHTENFTFSGSAYLHDLKLGTITPMPLDGSVFEYPFEVTADATTQGTRFKIVFSTTLGSDDFNNLHNITLYPNPASKNNGITVNLGKLELGTYSYRIVNMLGQEIQKGELTNQEINQEFKINFSTALSAGVYSFEILNQNKTIQTLKILIN